MQGGWAKGDKIFGKGGITKGPSWNNRVRNLYVTYELFDSNRFDEDSIKVMRNYGHSDTTISIIKLFDSIIVKLTDQPWWILIRHDHTEFDLSSWRAVVKIYPFTTLCSVNKHENIWANKFTQPIQGFPYWERRSPPTSRKFAHSPPPRKHPPNQKSIPPLPH